MQSSLKQGSATLHLGWLNGDNNDDNEDNNNDDNDDNNNDDNDDNNNYDNNNDCMRIKPSSWSTPCSWAAAMHRLGS